MSSNWKTKPLGEVASNVSRRFNFTGKDKVVFINTGDVLEGAFLHGNYSDTKGLPGQAKKAIEKGDILYSEIRPGNKRYVLVDFDPKDYVVSTKFMVIKPTDEILPEFLYLILTSRDCEQEFKIIADSRSGTFPQVTFDSISYFPINYPDKAEQKRILQITDSLSGKLAVNAKTNQTLEQIAQALFKSWFVNFDPVKAKIETLASGGSDDDAELAAMSAISAKTLDELNSLKTSNPEAFNKLAQTAALFPAAMQDSELGEIPEGWEVKQLSEICQVINGRAYKNTEFKTEGTPIVRIQNLSNGGKTVYSDLELPPEKYIDREDFIYAWSATFGPHIWRGPKSIYHYHIWKMEVDESVISRYFLYLSMFRKTEAMKNAGTGSIFTHLTKKIMESQHVLIGDHAINKKFSDIIVPIFDQISSLKNESTDLADIRDALLPKLLTGDGLTSEVANV